MGQGCCSSPGVRPEHFHCHQCGHCCTDLVGRWDQGDPRGRFQATDAAVYSLPTTGGLRMFSWEADRFPDEDLAPLLVVCDGHRSRPVALAYELQARRCPRWEEGAGCTIYEDRPLVCQAYPLLVVEGDQGPSVAISSPCPAKVPVIGAVQASARPERTLFGIYPNEAAPALAVPTLVARLADLVGFLEAADVIDPVPELDEETVSTWLDRGTVDLVDVVEEAGVMTRGDLEARAEDLMARLEDRWGPQT